MGKFKNVNVTSKYFRIFNNKSPANWMAHITRDFIACFSCSYYSSMILHAVGFLNLTLTNVIDVRFVLFQKGLFPLIWRYYLSPNFWCCCHYISSLVIKLICIKQSLNYLFSNLNFLENWVHLFNYTSIHLKLVNLSLINKTDITFQLWIC